MRYKYVIILRLSEVCYFMHFWIRKMAFFAQADEGRMMSVMGFVIWGEEKDSALQAGLYLFPSH